MTTINDVKKILETRPDNLTARRWLKDPVALKVILETHEAWNNDHIKIGEPHMVLPLETNVNSYVDQPALIEQLIKQKKEQSE